MPLQLDPTQPHLEEPLPTGHIHPPPLQDQRPRLRSGYLQEHSFPQRNGRCVQHRPTDYFPSALEKRAVGRGAGGVGSGRQGPPGQTAGGRGAEGSPRGPRPRPHIAGNRPSPHISVPAKDSSRDGPHTCPPSRQMLLPPTTPDPSGLSAGCPEPLLTSALLGLVPPTPGPHSPEHALTPSYPTQGRASSKRPTGPQPPCSGTSRGCFLFLFLHFCVTLFKENVGLSPLKSYWLVDPNQNQGTRARLSRAARLSSLSAHC